MEGGDLRMTSRRFFLLTIVFFFAGSLPFLVGHPSAVASAGLSLGFSAPLEHTPVLLILMAFGLLAALLPREGLVLIPVAFSLTILLGGMLFLDLNHYAALRYFILGSVLCLGLLMAIVRDKFTLLTLLVAASLGFHLGGFYMMEVPSIASPIYYLIGTLLSLGFGFAIALAFGVTFLGDHEASWERVKQSPQGALLRRFMGS
jgi:hydrogenase/urease accessory protein HupE